MEFNNLVEGILQSLNETKEAPDGYYYTEKGNLRKGNPESDGRGGPKFASDPTDRKNYGPREDEEGGTVEVETQTLNHRGGVTSRGYSTFETMEDLEKVLPRMKMLYQRILVNGKELGEDDPDEGDVLDDYYDKLELERMKREPQDGSEEDAEYRGRKVSLNKPTRGDVKKFKVYVKDPKSGNVKKVNFGHGGTSAKRKGEKTMKIRKSNPKARKSFRARHNCDNPGPKTKARYWSCKKW